MNNGPLRTKFRVICHVVASYAESKLGALFHHGQTTIPLCTTLEDLGHKQPPTPIENYNSTALVIFNSTVKQKNPRQWTWYYIGSKIDRSKDTSSFTGAQSKTNKTGYFNKYNPLSHHTVLRHEYLHKYNHIIRFLPSLGCINHGLGLTSPDMTREPGVPKSYCQEPLCSTSDCITLVPKEICPKYNRQ